MTSKFFSPSGHQWVTNLMFTEAGIKIGADKAYLVETRLSPLVRKYNLKDIETLINEAKMGKSSYKEEIIDALTTNETSFFRDIKPFDTLEKVTLPEFIQKNRGKKSIRIWSAACSSGQEAYSIRMVVDKFPELSSWKIDIVGTDISREIVAKANAAKYTQFEIQRGLATKDLIKYFQKEGNEWRAKPQLKKDVIFKVENIFRPSHFLGKFDIVFCRNLLIYFDTDTKKKALNSIYNQMNAGGHLYIGGAETLLGVHSGFTLRKENHGLYERAN